MTTSRSHPNAVSGQTNVTRPGRFRSASLARFAYSVNSLEELEPDVSSALAGRLEPGEVVRQIIVAPRQNILGARRTPWSWLNALLPWEWTPDWVLVLTGQRLLVAATRPPEPAPVVTSTSISEILSFELGTILLHSWFEWSRASQNRPERTRIYFNSVGDHYFREVLTSLQRALIAQTGLPAPQDGRHLEYLRELPFKFMNIITHRLLLPDEQVQAVVYRPAIWITRHRLFRQQRAAALTLVLSNYHLLIVQEELTRSPVSYGIITHYCPRSRIRRATLEREQDDRWLNLTLEWHGAEETLRVLFQGPAEQALRDLITRCSATHIAPS